jgi:hypothetical protein
MGQQKKYSHAIGKCGKKKDKKIIQAKQKKYRSKRCCVGKTELLYTMCTNFVLHNMIWCTTEDKNEKKGFY